MIIDLTDSSKLSLKYEILKFPDGHKHIKLDQPHYLLSSEDLTIKTRIKNYDDIFILKQLVSIIRSVNPSINIQLHIFYLLASRYDRSMFEHDSFDLKTVCNDIDSLKFNKVIVYEPHSNVTTTLLSNCEVRHPLDSEVMLKLNDYKDSEVCFVVPDFGAVKRIENFLSIIKRDINIVYSNKHRNVLTGEITGIDILNPDLLKQNVIIYDDLCDGGRTFTELAKTLRTLKYPTIHTRLGLPIEGASIVKHITLFVTHGIFSKSVEILLKENDEGSYLNEIYTTNSYQEQTDRRNFNVIQL